LVVEQIDYLQKSETMRFWIIRKDNNTEELQIREENAKWIL